MSAPISEAILAAYEQKVWTNGHRYVLKNLIGQGMFGSVFKGKDASSNKAVAIKVSKSNDNKTLIKEIEILRYISYANVEGREGLVQLKDHFRINRKLYVVYEMLGNSVESYIIKQPMTLRTIKKLAFSLCLSLRALSEIGIIHGDLKLDNIVFAGRNISEVKIIDFGLAQICKRSKYYPIQALEYRAPEVLLELGYGKEVDMWSLGCILFALLTQQSPIRGKCETDCMSRMVQVLGMPPKRMLDNSKVWNNFFELTYDFGFELQNKPCKPGSRPLRFLAMKRMCDGTKTENCQMTITPKLDFLLNLIEQMLQWHPEKRITPTDALQHQFFRN